jgi:uncharacterized protein (DUF362 family)/Pyruvate/2-oxoacid:ferredoxin oxidoreductase delta subunit
MEPKKTRVAVMQCTDYDTAALMEKIASGVALLGGFERFVRPGSTVLLKVNLIGPMPPESAAVTHPALVRAVIRLLKPLGATVWVGDSSGGAIGGKAQTGRAFEMSGIGRAAEEEGAVVKNFDREGVVEIKTASGDTMYLAKPALDADFIINLPKLKTHMLALYTGAVKNLFGCVPGLQKAACHKRAQSARAFGEVLCEINRRVTPALHIMDGVVAMDGQGPTTGRPFPAGKLLISADPLALDAVGTAIIGRDIRGLPAYAASVHEGVGEADLGRIEVCGDFDAPPRLAGFKLPRVMGAERSPGGLFGRMIDLVRTRPEVDQKACRRCNACVESCPVNAIDRETKRIDYGACIACMCCHEMCAYRAVKLVRANPALRLFSRPQ